MNVYPHGTQASSQHLLSGLRASPLEVRGRGEKLLSVALSPVKRPPSLLSRLPRYQGNATVAESLLLAPHSGSVSPLQRGETDAAFTASGATNEQELNSAVPKKHWCISDLCAECKDHLLVRRYTPFYVGENLILSLYQ